MTLSSTATLSFIAMPVIMRPAVLESINKAWKRGISKITEIDYAPEAVKRAREEGRCDGGVWEVSMKDTPWLPSSHDKVSWVPSICPKKRLLMCQIKTHTDQPVDDVRVRGVQLGLFLPHLCQR